MEEIIHIKCPFDGAVLTIKNMPNIESKYITCPVCKKKYLFGQFRLVSAPQSPQVCRPTDYPQPTDVHSKGTQSVGSDQTDCPDPTELPREQTIIGQLVCGNQTIALKPGRNVVGRKSQNSQATIQLAMGEKRALSREHLVIDVRLVEGFGYIHYATLFKEAVNATSVNRSPLKYGECVKLNDGDLLCLPDVTLKFVIPDPDKTDFAPVDQDDLGYTCFPNLQSKTYGSSRKEAPDDFKL